jgi:hypothetical protein
MRLIHRHRNHRPKTPRIPISQEEIAADLHYPASQSESSRASSTRRRTPKPLAPSPV